MEFSKENIDDLLYIKVETIKATYWEADYFNELLTKEIGLGKRKFIIDLSNCKIIDPPFLSTLILFYKKVIKLGGNVKIVKPLEFLSQNEGIKNSLNLFELLNTKNDALDSYKTIFTIPAEEMFYPKISTIAS